MFPRKGILDITNVGEASTFFQLSGTARPHPICRQFPLSIACKLVKVIILSIYYKMNQNVFLNCDFDTNYMR